MIKKRLVSVISTIMLLMIVLLLSVSCKQDDKPVQDYNQAPDANKPIEFADHVFHKSLASALGLDESEAILPKDLNDYRSIYILADRVMLYKEGETPKTIVYHNHEGSQFFDLDGERLHEEGTIQSFEDLANFSNLMIIDISFQKNADFNTLKGNYDSVVTVRMFSNNLEDIEFARNFKNLQYFTTSFDSFTDLNPLKDLSQLKRIIARYGDLVDISGLEGLDNLEAIDFRNNDIIDISALKNLSNLNNIILHSNNIEDISALKNLENLEYLDLADNKIQDVSPLVNLNTLNRLFINENPTSNIDLLNDFSDIMN